MIVSLQLHTASLFSPPRFLCARAAAAGHSAVQTLPEHHIGPTSSSLSGLRSSAVSCCLCYRELTKSPTATDWAVWAIYFRKLSLEVNHASIDLTWQIFNLFGLSTRSTAESSLSHCLLIFNNEDVCLQRGKRPSI